MREVPAKIYRIKLASDERSALEKIRDRGSNKSARFKHALALLMCDEGADGPALKDSDIATAIGTKVITVERLRKRCCEVGPLEAIERKKREVGPREIKLTGEVEAHITRLACSNPPEGHTRWSLGLIAGKLVELQVVESISRPSVGKVLKKANSNRGV
jgi:hypothetical protein